MKGSTQRRRRRERGALLGIVLILLVVVLVGAGLAVLGVQYDTAAAGADRTARQLQDCAEQGLEWGKQFFSGSGSDWNQFLQANTVCASSSPLPCTPSGPFRNGSNGPPSAYPTYPTGAPFTNTISMGGSQMTVNGLTFTTGAQPLTYTVAIYDNSEDTEGASQNYTSNNDTTIVVYSLCRDPASNQRRSAQAVLQTVTPTNIDYIGQSGFGFRNQGNQNQ
jgi:hypothetical protein